MKKEILIVEDHFYLQKTLIDWLVQVYPEAEILAADNIDDAIDALQVSLPSLIIMDLYLPHSDGFAAMCRIKAEHPHIPIIVMTDLDCSLHRDYASSAGADACLLKDSIQTELLPVIDRLLDNALENALNSKSSDYLKEEEKMMDKAMYENFMGQWQNLFKMPLPASGMEKQKDAFLKLCKVEQENIQAFVGAFQNYFQNISQIGNIGDVGKLWQNYLDSSQTLVTSLDSCRQNRHQAFLSFYQDLMPQAPARTAAAKK